MYNMYTRNITTSIITYLLSTSKDSNKCGYFYLNTSDSDVTKK